MLVQLRPGRIISLVPRNQVVWDGERRQWIIYLRSQPTEKGKRIQVLPPPPAPAPPAPASAAVDHVQPVDRSSSSS